MALIEDAAKRRKEGKSVSTGSYERVFNDKELGYLISDVQSTSISNGNELEKKIITKAKDIVIDNPKVFQDLLDRKYTGSQELFLIPKKIIKKSDWGNSNEPDFIIFNRKTETIFIIELKDGWVFDTKKSLAEREGLEKFMTLTSPKVSYKMDYFICSFSNNDVEEIHKGLKSAIDIEHIMTGKKFCELLGISYDEINNERAIDGEKNANYFIENVLKINKVREWIRVNISTFDEEK